MDTKAVLSRIERKRLEAGLSKTEMYKLAGVTGGAFSQWRQGLTNPSITTLESLANVLGTTYEYLVAGNEIPATVANDSGLSQKEELFLNLFRSLAPDRQAQVIAQLQDAALAQAIRDGSSKSE